MPIQCAVPPKTKPKFKLPFFKRVTDYVTHLFERDSQEFIGWHGTNSVGLAAIVASTLCRTDSMNRTRPPCGRNKASSSSP